MLKPRQPQKQHRTPKAAARLAPTPALQRSSGGGIGGASARSATFAQSIAGKYGYRVGDPFGRLALVFLQAGAAASEPKKSGAAGHRDLLVRLQLQLEALRHPEAPQLPSLQRMLVQLVPVWMRHNDAGQWGGIRADGDGKRQAEPGTARRERADEGERDSRAAPKAGDAAAAVWRTRRPNPGANDAYEHAKRPVWKRGKTEETAATHMRRPVARGDEASQAVRIRRTTDTANASGVRLQQLTQQFFDKTTQPTTTQTNAAARLRRRPALAGQPPGEADTSSAAAPEPVLPEPGPAVLARRELPASAVRTAAQKLLPPSSVQPMLSHVQRQRQDRGTPSPWRWEAAPAFAGEAAVRHTALQQIVLQRKHMEVSEHSPERRLWPAEVRSGEAAPRRMASRQTAGLQRMQAPQADDASAANARRLLSGAAAMMATAAAGRTDERMVQTLAAWLTHLRAARSGQGEGSRPSEQRRSFAAPDAPGDEAGSGRGTPRLQRRPVERTGLARAAEPAAGEGESALLGTPAVPHADVPGSAAPSGGQETGRSGAREASFVPRLVAQAVRDSFGMKAPDETAARIAPLQLMRSRSELARFTAWAQQRARRREEGAAIVPAAGSRPDASRIVRRRPLSGTLAGQPLSTAGAHRWTVGALEAGEPAMETGMSSAPAAYMQPRRLAPFAPLQAASHPHRAGDDSLMGGDEAGGHVRQSGRVRSRPAAKGPHETRLVAKRSGNKRPSVQDGEWPPAEAGGAQARARPVPAAMAEKQGGPAALAPSQAGRSRPVSIVQLARWVPAAAQPGAPRLSVLPRSAGPKSVAAVAAAQLASAAAPTAAMAPGLRAAHEQRIASPERRPALSPPTAAAPAQSGSAPSPGLPAARASVRSAALLATNASPAANALTAPPAQPVPAAIVRTAPTHAQRAPAIIARKVSRARFAPPIMTGMGPPAAPLAPPARMRTVSPARADSLAAIRRQALPSARPAAAIITRSKVSTARSALPITTSTAPPAAALAPAARMRTMSPARADSPATIRRQALPSAQQPVHQVSPSARSAPAIIARSKVSPARSALPITTGTAPPAASLAPSARMRTMSPAQADSLAAIRRQALPSAQQPVRQVSPSARSAPVIIARKVSPARKVAPARSASPAITGMRPPAVPLAPPSIARAMWPARPDSPALIRRQAALSARLVPPADASRVSSAWSDSPALVRPAPLTVRSMPLASARKAPPARPASSDDALSASPAPAAEWRAATGDGLSAQADRPAAVWRKPAPANVRAAGADAQPGRSVLPGDESIAQAIVRRRLEHAGAAAPAAWQGRSLSRLHEAAPMRPRARRAERSALAGRAEEAAPGAAARLQLRRAEPAAAATRSRDDAAVAAAAARIVRRALPAARAESAAERQAPLPPALRQARPAAARMNAARAASAADAPAAAGFLPPSGSARTPGEGGEARARVRRQADGGDSVVSHRSTSPRAGERAALTAGDARSLPAAARAGAAIGQRAAAPANVIQLRAGMLERRARERSAAATTAERERTRPDAAAATAGITAATRTFATHHFTFEHKLASAGSANGTQRTQHGANGSEAAHLPPALDWLQRRPAVVHAASPEPEPERTEPQINIAQLQEIIKKLPQFDVRKLADRVYRELEKKLRFDRQTRGL